MNNDLLANSIKIIYDMELNNYAMNRAINKMNKQIAQLGQPRSIDKPEYGMNNYYLRKDAKYLLKEKSDSFNDNGKVYPEISGLGSKYGTGFGLPIILALIAVVLTVIDGLSGNSSAFRKVITIVIESFIHGAIGLAVGGLITFIINSVTGAAKQKDDNNTAKKQFELDKDLYNAAVKNDNNRVNRESRERNMLIDQRDALITRRKQAYNKLINYYEKVGIDSKYRNIVPMGYMEEFIRLGISNKLTGTDGLYYLVRRELRDDQLNHTLDEISNKLNVLIDQNHVIYSEIQGMNQKCDRIVSSTIKAAETAAKNSKKLDEINNSASIAAYNSERIKQEAKFTNYMLMWDSINKYDE